MNATWAFPAGSSNRTASLRQGAPEGVATRHWTGRRVDRGLATLRRLLAWYGGGYDQRRDSGRAAVLRAADELARSCWSAAFGAVGRKPPSGPLCFVDNRLDAYAGRRCEVPSELLPATDDPVAEFVARLPIPVITRSAGDLAEGVR